MTDAELNALCAEKVAGYNTVQPNPLYPDRLAGFECPGSRDMVGIPSYTTDPAAVLGLLEKYDWIAGNHLLDGDYFCEINYPESRIIERAPTFALAATLALLKAHGVDASLKDGGIG